MLNLKRTWDGRIKPPYSCEINAVDHCNKSCLDCNHASPVQSPWFADPAIIERDFRMLSAYYYAPIVKILGGEPLLHPDLPKIFNILRRSGVAKRLLLLTNGTLPECMTRDIWQGIDIVVISVYPDSQVDKTILDYYQRQADHFRKTLRIINYDDFRRTFVLDGTNDANQVQHIYSTCKLAQVWGCQSIHTGYIHRCPQSIYIPRLVTAIAPNGVDGLPIQDVPGFRKKLWDYLTSPQPCWSCQYCLGTTGAPREHRMVPASEWLSYQSYASS